ncbi:ABC-F family ATP-binding cassette domain-containing protein [Biformimicrobium ophioploci]|uniref:ATP-binding cassette domain-containing protein n=1 Tax=Biformimicrobium ophioploci TaxID=3036711 RepID=A0ABQ6LVV1_9GAMM|nr:ATP-binding cassette domain-containing protein [Microbulbifer sp. NKW57]GMG86191.1 ATP-binding cassette domain-containing protein [Microbulbifer sp. NKW57]
MIVIQNLSLLRGGRQLLSSADLRINPGDKIGLIGANGAGKSSLFKLLLGELEQDGGELQVPAGWRLAHMAQEVEASNRSALDYVIDGDTELRRVQAALEKDALDGSEEALLHERMAQIDGYSAEARAAQLLDGLGFAPADQSRPVSGFSGGWRIRLNLARALMCPSDLLLLDEPTNHLDLDATLWLESWLQRYPGTLLIISHDRDFLDAVVGRIVSFDNRTLVAYAGNYSSYERQRAERLAQQQAQYEKQQAQRAHMEDFVRRFRAKATKAKQAQSRLKALDRMADIAPAHVDSPFHFTLPTSDKTSNPLLDLREADLGYADNVVLGNISLALRPGQRIGLLGPNGAGKSTLIKTLASEQSPLRGSLQGGEHLRIGYFAQHQLEALDSSADCVLHVQRLSPDASEQQVRDFLGSFGFIGDRVFEAVGSFSGGEKARLALALIAWQKPNLLLLDEPTNHLDLEVRHALTVALAEFEGAVVLVSHDRHLLRNTVDEFLLVAEGRVAPFSGDLDDYRDWLIDHRRRSRAQESTLEATGDTEAPRIDRRAQRQQAAAQREKLKPLTNRLKKLEAEMATAEKELARVETALADEALYSGSQREKLVTLTREQDTWRERLETAEMEWLEVSEQVESLRAG